MHGHRGGLQVTEAASPGGDPVGLAAQGERGSAALPKLVQRRNLQISTVEGHPPRLVSGSIQVDHLAGDHVGGNHLGRCGPPAVPRASAPDPAEGIMAMCKLASGTATFGGSSVKPALSVDRPAILGREAASRAEFSSSTFM